MQSPNAHITRQGKTESRIGATPSATSAGQPNAMPAPITATASKIIPRLPRSQTGTNPAKPPPPVIAGSQQLLPAWTAFMLSPVGAAAVRPSSRC